MTNLSQFLGLLHEYLYQRSLFDFTDIRLSDDDVAPEDDDWNTYYLL